MAFDKNLTAHRIKVLRIDKGMSQLDLANKADVDLSSIAKYETAQTMPSLATAYKIAQALGCSINALTDLETPQLSRTVPSA